MERHGSLPNSNARAKNRQRKPRRNTERFDSFAFGDNCGDLPSSRLSKKLNKARKLSLVDRLETPKASLKQKKFRDMVWIVVALGKPNHLGYARYFSLLDAENAKRRFSSEDPKYEYSVFSLVQRVAMRSK